MTTSPSSRFISLVMLFTFSATASGCYKNIAIRPDQIPRLSDMPSPTVIGQSGNTTMLAVPVATVMTPYGTMVEVKGQYRLTLRLANDREYIFDPPVRSILDHSGKLLVAGSNASAIRFDLDDIREAIVRQSDPGMTTLVFVIVPLVALALGVGIYFAVAD